MKSQVNLNDVVESGQREKVKVVIISTMEEEIFVEVEVEEPLEKEDVETSINGETIISIHPIKEEVETLFVLSTVAEKEVITTKRGQIVVVFTVKTTIICPLLVVITSFSATVDGSKIVSPLGLKLLKLLSLLIEVYMSSSSKGS